jgi:hypothetical protein
MSRKNREGVVPSGVVNSRKLQRFQVDVRDRLSGTRDFKELGEQLVEHSLARVGVTGLNLFPFIAGGIDLHPVTFCERDSAENVARKALEMLPHAEEETLAIENCCRWPGTIICLDEYLSAAKLTGSTRQVGFSCWCLSGRCFWLRLSRIGRGFGLWIGHGSSPGFGLGYGLWLGRGLGFRLGCGFGHSFGLGLGFNLGHDS